MLLSINSAQAVEFASGEQATTVIELYTSEGCSSCPPAEAWLSTFRSDKHLFKKLIPMAFHVDYWDQLGWKDKYAQHAFTERQQTLVAQGLVSQVYTPGIVVASHEWRQWFNGARTYPVNTAVPGVLTVNINDQQLQAKFASDEPLIMNVAYLAMGLETEVKAGENRNRLLKHDFVVLKHWATKGKDSWDTQLPAAPDIGQQQTVLVVWLSHIDSLQIIQAAAHRLD